MPESIPSMFEKYKKTFDLLEIGLQGGALALELISLIAREAGVEVPHDFIQYIASGMVLGGFITSMVDLAFFADEYIKRATQEGKTVTEQETLQYFSLLRVLWLSMGIINLVLLSAHPLPLKY